MSQSASLPMNFGGLELDDKISSFEFAQALIWPVPFEKTVSYGHGTQHGPAAIIDASRNMELYDEEFDAEIARIGIHTLDAIDTKVPADKMMQRLYEEAKRLLQTNKFLCMLGGEHSITGPVVRAHFEKYPDLTVLQIDAHADLRESYDGTPNSHASVMRRVVELCPAVQVGIRALSLEEARAIPSLRTTVYYAKDIVGHTHWIQEVISKLSDNVYLTFDVDGLDPSLMPSTGTPEPGGLQWYESLNLIRAVAEKKRIVGMDVVELAPSAGNHAPNFLTAKLIYKILGYVFRDRIPSR